MFFRGGACSDYGGVWVDFSYFWYCLVPYAFGLVLFCVGEVVVEEYYVVFLFWCFFEYVLEGCCDVVFFGLEDAADGSVDAEHWCGGVFDYEDFVLWCGGCYVGCFESFEFLFFFGVLLWFEEHDGICVGLGVYCGFGGG